MRLIKRHPTIRTKALLKGQVTSSSPPGPGPIQDTQSLMLKGKLELVCMFWDSGGDLVWGEEMGTPGGTPILPLPLPDISLEAENE